MQQTFVLSHIHTNVESPEESWYRLVTKIQISLKNRQTPLLASIWASATIAFQLQSQILFFHFPITDTDMSNMLYDTRKFLKLGTILYKKSSRSISFERRKQARLFCFLQSNHYTGGLIGSSTQVGPRNVKLKTQGPSERGPKKIKMISCKDLSLS